jgi:cytochrome c-type biogenesis protein CcmH/NrfF
MTILVALAGFTVLSLMGCGGEPAPKQPDPQEMARQDVARQAANLSADVEQVKQDFENVRENQALAMGDLQTQLLKLSQKTANLQSSLNALTASQAPAKAASENTGWHWFFKVLLGLVIVVILYVVFKRMTREEAEDQDLQDEEFMEENDLGTIRYPGGAKDAGNKPESQPPKA